MSYRLNIQKRKKGSYLTIEFKYHDKEKGSPRSKHHATLGYLDDLKKEFDDPIEHYKAIVQEMNDERERENIISMVVDLSEELPENTDNRFNFGYAVIMKVFHELELDRFFQNKARHEPFKYNTSSIMKLMVISRILEPSSLLCAYSNKDRYFERFDFSGQDMYRSLSHFSKVSSECQAFLSEKTKEKYGRDTSLVYFDVTNFHFEIDEEDDFRRFGKEKNRRPDPIVQMALAADANGIPLYYKAFPGNTHDSKTFIPVFKEVGVKFNPGRMIAVADSGCSSADNIYFLKGGDGESAKNGYIFSFPFRNGSEDLKDFILSEKDYRNNRGILVSSLSEEAREDVAFKIKSRHVVRRIQVTMNSGRKKGFDIVEKQVICWSKKYALRSKLKRYAYLQKALDIIENPSKYNKSTTKGASSYIKDIQYDKTTGEIIEGTGKSMVLDEEKAKTEALFDGYHCLISSELDMPDREIHETYAGLSDIEDNFRVSKSDLNLRPAYVSKEESLNAHMLTCFLALTFTRLIQKKTDYKYSPEKIQKCLNSISCSNEFGNIYLFDHRSEISDALGRAFGIDFKKKRMALGEIKKVLADTKK